VNIRLYDVENRIFFKNVEYYFTNVSDVTKRDYTWAKQQSLDTAPTFPTNSKVENTLNDEKETIISF
jgi:hypothetical protein